MQKKFSVRAPDPHGLLVVYRGTIEHTSSEEYMVTIKKDGRHVKVGNIYGRPWRNMFSHNPLTGKSVGGRKWHSTSAHDGFVELARTLSIHHVEQEILSKLPDFGSAGLTRLTHTISRDNIEYVMMERLNRMVAAAKSLWIADQGDK